MIRQAIDSGLDALLDAQCRSGEFRTYWWRPEAPEHATYVESPFLTAIVCDLLAPLAQDERVDRLSRLGVEFLTGWRSGDGMVRFLREGIDADCDDTSVVHLVLQRVLPDALDYGLVADKLARQVRRDGLVETWIRDDPSKPNEFDPCVWVNTFRFLESNGWPAPYRDFAAALRAWKPGRGTLFYVSPCALPYFMCQFRTPELVFGAASFCVSILETSGHTDVLDAAFRLSAAGVLGGDPALLRSLARLLISYQGADGRWPRVAAFRAFNHWGGADLTTAAAIRGLADAACSLGVAL